MLGIIIGIICLVLLIKVIRGPRHYRRRGCAGRRYHRGGYGYGGPGRFLHYLFDRLDTGPGQEKVIRGAVEQFVDTVRDQRGEWTKSRTDLAAAVRTDSFRDDDLEGAFARQGEALDRVRQAGLESLRQIHEALDEGQRKKLARIIESGPGMWGWAH